MSGKRLKVAVVITRLSAGAGGVALRGALALDPTRYDITLITGSVGFMGDGASRRGRILTGRDAIADAPTGDLLPEAYHSGLKVVRLADLVPRISPRRDSTAIATLTQLIGSQAYDIVHTHSSKAGALGRVAASRAGASRIVHTYHGFPFHEFQPWPVRQAYVTAERWLGRRTHAFLAVGTAVAAEAVRRRLAAPNRIWTILSAVQPVCLCRTADAARAAARLRLGLPAGARVVGTVGRVDYQKAPEQWVDAFAAVEAQDVLGVWIGDGPLRDRLLRHARRRGVADRFRLLGHRDDVAELLPALDVFALSSRYEGLPCALVEAVTAGIPVASTAVNSVPDLVVPGDTGLLVPPNAPRLLACAITHLLDNPTDAARMAANARERVGDRYAPAALADVLSRIYRGDRIHREETTEPAPAGAESVGLALSGDRWRLPLENEPLSRA